MLSCVKLLLGLLLGRSLREAVAPELRNLGLRDQTCTAVLATKDPNLLIHWSSAVAGDVSYCWGPAIQEIEVCGGEHSSACLLSEGPNMRRFGRCCGVRKLSPSSRFHMTASMKPFSMISSTDKAVNTRNITNANLSNTRRKMARFVLKIE